MHMVIPANHNGLPRDLPLVGRERELRELCDHLQVNSGRGEVRFVSGQAGVGKSRLVRAAALEAERRGWTVAEGRACPVESAIAYQPFGDVFRGILRGLGAETEAMLTETGAKELAYLFPALGLRPGHPIAWDAEDPVELRTRLMCSFGEFLYGCSERQPLLVLLEDVHFADPSSLRLLHFVARHSAGRPVRFIATYTTALRRQNPDLMETERSLSARNAGDHLTLGPLASVETAELVRRTFRVSGSPSDTFSDRLHHWTQGYPFFVEETLKALVESGALYLKEGVWLGWEVHDLALSSALREDIRARLARLDVDARKVVDLASVIGGPSSQRLLARLTGFDAMRFLAASEEPTDLRILFETERDGEIVYDFVHPVVRRAVYDELGLARAKLLRGAAAEATRDLSRTPGTEPVDAQPHDFSRASLAGVAVRSERYHSRGRHAAPTRATAGSARDASSDSQQSGPVPIVDLVGRWRTRRAATGGGGLTARELEIARLVGERQSSKAIGKVLGISHRTVSTHLTNIYKKLSVSTRVQLGDMVRERRLPCGPLMSSRREAAEVEVPDAASTHAPGERIARERAALAQGRTNLRLGGKVPNLVAHGPRHRRRLRIHPSTT